MEEYKPLQEKYNLPNLTDFEKDFGIVEVEDHQILIGIRSKMMEKIDYFTNIASELLQPDADLNSIYECRFLTENQKQELFKLFKTLVSYSRRSNALSTSYEESEEAEFIKELFSEWQKIKVILKKDLLSLSNSWKNELEQVADREDYMR